MHEVFDTIFKSAAAVISTVMLLFTGASAPVAQRPIQPASAVVAVAPTAQNFGSMVSSPAPTSAAIAINSPAPTLIEVPQPTTIAVTPINFASISKNYVDDQIQILRNSLSSEIFKYSSAQFPNAPGISQYTANLAVSQRIDQLTGTRLSNITVSGVSGLTAADIPTDITASNYLPLTGGALTSTLTVAGNVGVGTTSPYAQFSIATPNGATGSQTTLFAIASSTATATTTLFAVTNAGNVGIGTSTPRGRLSILGTGGGTVYDATDVNAQVTISPTFEIANSAGSNNNFTQIVFNNRSGTQGSLARIVSGFPAASKSMLAFVTGSSGSYAERMRIDSTGFVGIGTTTPWRTLSVNGSSDLGTNALAGYFIATSSTASVLPYASSTALTVSGNAYLATSAGNVLVGGTDSSTEIAYGSLLKIIGTRPALYLSDSGEKNFSIYSDGSSLNFRDATAGVVRGVFDTNGNFGIGSTTPYAKLSVKGAGSTTGVNFQTTNSSDSPLFTILDSGNVGIGSTTPWGLLSVNANGLASGAPQFVVGSSTKTNFIVANSGNVGVGTTVPSALFEIAANSTAANPSMKINDVESGGYMTIGEGSSGAGQFTPWLLGVVKGSARSVLIDSFIDSGDDTGTAPSMIFRSRASGVAVAIRPILAVRNNTTDVLDILANGNVGIASTTPWRTLGVTGTVGFDGLTGSTGAGSLCLSANKEVVYNSGSDSCLSSTRATKHDIVEIGVSGSTVISALQPVSFIYNNDASSTVRYGFIAEDTAAVDAHLATYDAAGAISGIDDRSIISILVKALKELLAEVQALATVVAGFADSFTTNRLCVGSTCITETELKALLEERSISASSPDGSSGNFSGSGDTATSTPDTTPPVITLSGANPAHIDVGATYIDLGASVTDNVDQNLGYQVSLGGATSTDPSALVLDTSTSTTHIITYSATDQAGNEGLTTRTVIVGE